MGYFKIILIRTTLVLVFPALNKKGIFVWNI